MTSLSTATVTQWYQHFRDSCSRWLINHPEKIGGPGIIVQIDESLVERSRYEKGREKEKKWIFGGYCPDQNLGFLQFLEKRDAETVLPLIMENIAAGSIIHSDFSLAYANDNITTLPVDPPYQHLCVDHSQHSESDANHIEAFWSHAQEKLERMFGCHSAKYASYLDEFMWHQRFGREGPIATMNFLMEQIADWYPTP